MKGRSLETTDLSPLDTATETPSETASYPDDLRLEVENYLEDLIFSPDPALEGLQDAMRYSLLAGGKRIRPVLTLATAKAVGHEPRSVLPLAAAIELIHTYSLIHDDLPAMDDDDLRRGRPTSHKQFGDAVAILAGDALYAEAFALLLREQTGDPAAILAAAGELASATGVSGMVGGQYIDVTQQADVDGTALRRLHELKTGRLIAASIECVLLLLGRDRTAFRQFASELGVLFQIVDDILDVTGTTTELGKPGGSDARHGRHTYVTRYGLADARELAARSHRSAREALRCAVPGGAAELEQITDFIYARPS